MHARTCTHLHTYTHIHIYTHRDTSIHIHTHSHPHSHALAHTQVLGWCSGNRACIMTQPRQQTLDSVPRQLHQPQTALASTWHLSSDFTMVLSFASSPLPKREGEISSCPKKSTHLQLFGLISFTNQILTDQLLCAVVLEVGDRDTVPVRPQEAPTSSRRKISEKTNLT